MGRFIDARDLTSPPGVLTLAPGDLILFAASGGWVESADGSVEVLGPFTHGQLLDDGSILSPAGSPNTIMFLARRGGRGAVQVVTGDPWSATKKTRIEVTVQG